MINNNGIWVDTSRLIFNPLWVNKSISNNWEFSCLMTEISVFGILKPIVVTSDCIIIDGNCRLQIAKELKITQVPIILYEEDKLNDLETNKIKPSTLIMALQIIEDKYGLKPYSRYNKVNIPNVLIVLRKLFFGGDKQLKQLYQLKELNNKVKKSYPIECNLIWNELDTFQITLEEGLNQMNKLNERRTTINFKLYLDYEMVA
jgi:hypothetical protein